MVKVNVKNILLTDPIIKAIKTINPGLKLEGFGKYPGEQGFTLPRIDENLQKREEGTDAPAITLKPYKQTKYYTIQDGRHRFAIAVAKGESEIEATIQGGGKRKTRKRKSLRRRKTRR